MRRVIQKISNFLMLFCLSSSVSYGQSKSCGLSHDEASKLLKSKLSLHLVGTVSAVAGECFATSTDQNRRKLKIGDPIYAGDFLETETNANLTITALSGEKIILNPQSFLQLFKFQECVAECTFVSRAFIGTMRFIQHGINQFEKPNLITPTSIIGRRGTDHEVTILKEGDPRGPAGTYDRVYSGGTTMKNSGGSIDINPGQTGFSTNTNLIPQLL